MDIKFPVLRYTIRKSHVYKIKHQTAWFQKKILFFLDSKSIIRHFCFANDKITNIFLRSYGGYTHRVVQI